jgi:hypothetical protein
VPKIAPGEERPAAAHQPWPVAKEDPDENVIQNQNSGISGRGKGMHLDEGRRDQFQDL